MSKTLGTIVRGVTFVGIALGRNPVDEERCIERGLLVQFSREFPQHANPTTKNYAGYERGLELWNAYFSGNLPSDLPIHTTAAELADAAYKGREASKDVRQLCVYNYHAF